VRLLLHSGVIPSMCPALTPAHFTRCFTPAEPCCCRREVPCDLLTWIGCLYRVAVARGGWHCCPAMLPCYAALQCACAGRHATFCRRARRAPDCDQLPLPACKSQQLGVNAMLALPLLPVRVGLQSYYWYKKTREKCIAEQGDACPMGGYTRLLHRCAAVLTWCRRDGSGSGRCLATHLPAAWTGAAHLQPQCLAFLVHPACGAPSLQRQAG